MIVIEGTIRLPVDGIEAACPAMEAMVRASRAETGCLDYAYSLDLIDPGLVRVTERWESREALKAHFATPHMAAWRVQFADLCISDRSLRFYEAEAETI
jgi:quinol monooxygenase YgiN